MSPLFLISPLFFKNRFVLLKSNLGNLPVILLIFNLPPNLAVNGLTPTVQMKVRFISRIKFMISGYKSPEGANFVPASPIFSNFII